MVMKPCRARRDVVILVFPNTPRAFGQNDTSFEAI
jgi:hypothetical protein